MTRAITDDLEVSFGKENADTRRVEEILNVDSEGLAQVQDGHPALSNAIVRSGEEDKVGAIWFTDASNGQPRPASGGSARQKDC